MENMTYDLIDLTHIQPNVLLYIPWGFKSSYGAFGENILQLKINGRLATPLLAAWYKGLPHSRGILDVEAPPHIFPTTNFHIRVT